MWETVTGQDRAVALLRKAAARPGHAYLLAGPAGSGVSRAARCFAAALVCPERGCGVCSSCLRALRVRHPDVVEIEPEGTFILKEQAEEMIREAFTSPFEAPRKVIIVAEADRMNETAASKLLKTLEEPGDRTHFVLLTDTPDDLLPTVRSRCQRIDFVALPEATVRSALEADGVDPATAATAARLSSGRLERARALAGEWAPLRQVALATLGALDGTGAAAARAAEDVGTVIGEVVSTLEATHKREDQALEAELVEAGYPDRLARRLRRDLAQRHQRAQRRARTDALAEAITAFETWFRDDLVTARPRRSGEENLTALDACRSVQAVVAGRTAVNEALLLERLLLGLSPAR